MFNLYDFIFGISDTARYKLLNNVKKTKLGKDKYHMFYLEELITLDSIKYYFTIINKNNIITKIFILENDKPKCLYYEYKQNYIYKSNDGLLKINFFIINKMENIKLYTDISYDLEIENNNVKIITSKSNINLI